MSTDLLEQAARSLRDEGDSVADSAGEVDREVRARAVAAMETALRAKSKRKQLRRRTTTFALAAAGVLSIVGAERLVAMMRMRARPAPATAESTAETTATLRRLDGIASTWHNGQPVPFEGKLENGDRVTTAPDAHAEIALSTGTTVQLGPSADTTFVAANKLQSFSLSGGTVRARVAKLHEGERFLVRTSDAEVEVRGTVFEVSLVDADATCGNGTPTRVTVREGVVVVRRDGNETRVAAGETWPAGCVAAAKAPVAPIAAATNTVEAPKPLQAAQPSVSVAPSADVLAAQNDLFASALAAKRRGELNVALTGFDAYLAKYPGGQLVESATAQRMNVLGKLDPARGAAAARAYLARFPAGFARVEAEALIAADPASASP